MQNSQHYAALFATKTTSVRTTRVSLVWYNLVMIATDLKLPIEPKMLARLLKRAGATQAFVFGSYARGEQTPSSDLDLFIKVKRGVSLFDVLGLQSELEQQAGVPVDLTTKINPHFAEYIEPELVEIAL